MTTSNINWAANALDKVVIETKDYRVQYATKLQFKTPVEGLPGYQLIYRPSGHVQMEGVDVVAAVANVYREQRVLDRVKAKPSLLSEDPSEANLASFLADTDTSGQTAN